MTAVKVLICDDQELVRVGMGMIVTSQDDLTVAGEATNGAEAVEAAEKLRPDLVLMDVRMPVLDGVAATERICRSLPDTRVLMITTFDLDEYAYAALRAGASGFLVKDAPADEILVAIRGVLRGDSMVSPSVTKRLLDRYLADERDAAESARLETLTEREKDVLSLIARGLTNSEIAAKLYIGETTVKTHVGRILAKLSLRDRVHAVVFAYESGLVRAGG
ncbi:response regulator [Amycolatopsis japonica]|uniref:DNA-binding response regulator n=1 Tax=Amycolatopsis keratiniphila subsp. keratiniphila TaxID=227715 RepID=A0A1W2LHL0_9PSEU|nr:response regulator transcription factor [Amycolatopsis keratiniphila]OLZ54175.1 DNA-binding response regulator [Amycolatopsis keratiniphila subsp. nogabecina]ONF62349.1 DNA-binding response regulator [Amycolatopsis keratiniphila subsp. keratiniphila]SDU63731.1 DNA-binding response regulator, NarL/FixJ family, contains REC and HTH domains [Amycolatopsis keratiniphila]